MGQTLPDVQSAKRVYKVEVRTTQIVRQVELDHHVPVLCYRSGHRESRIADEPWVQDATTGRVRKVDCWRAGLYVRKLCDFVSENIHKLGVHASSGGIPES